ncbi:MAG TPA: ATP-binding protein [Vicinamibacterales bacterium]|nr:ATP-binding protein [Vicinamibacterales bacterium]
MSKRRHRPPQRNKAGIFAAVDRAQDVSESQVRKLLHELQVHSEEITVQNEQLLKAQSELEQARDRYADLYDFAPVGYVSLDARGSTVDINLAAAELLERPRSFAIGVPFASMIIPADLGKLRQFLVASRECEANRPVRVDVRVRKQPARIIRLIARPHGLGPGPSHLLTALTDVTEERRLDAERNEALQREQIRATELAREVAERTRAEARVKALLERLVNVQEEERRRLARNLHDHLGQQLTALRLSIDTLKNRKLPDREIDKKLGVIDKLSSQIDRDVDLLAWDLRPPALDDMGLNAALSAFLQEWSSAHDIVAEFQASTFDAMRLRSDIESNLYRIVQEALNNVSKHAGATQVSVMIERRDEDVILIVEDNGRGFNPDAVTAAGDRHGGMGLVSIRERAALVGGHVEIESAIGEGTTVFVRVPARTVPLLTP